MSRLLRLTIARACKRESSRLSLSHAIADSYIFSMNPTAPMYQYNCKYTSLVEQIYAKICLGRVVPGFVRDDGSKLLSSLTCSISAVYDSSATFEPEEKAESCTPRYLRYSRRRRYTRFAHGADPQCGTTCSDIAADGSTRPMQVPDIAAIMTDRAVLYVP